MTAYSAAMPRRTLPVWGANIQRLIRQQGRTATEIAERCEPPMTVQQLSNVMNAADPRIGTLARIAVALGVDLAIIVASGPTESSEASSHAAQRVVAVDPRIVRAQVVELFTRVLAGALDGLADADESADESGANPLSQRTREGAQAPRIQRASR